MKDLYTCMKDPSGPRIFLCEGSFGVMDLFFACWIFFVKELCVFCV